MTSDATAMLFCPPRPPVQLEAGSRVVVGRKEHCDLWLREGGVSREHFEVRAEGDAFVLRDLGSKNGTFVNGERVAERRLEPGDRIELGSCTVIFCRLQGLADDAGGSNADTIFLDTPTTGPEALRGDLAEVPAFALIQLLELGRNSGVLALGDGRIWFANGAPVHAQDEKREGMAAAIALLNSAAGLFRFEPGHHADARTIEASATELLLEASRIFDEQ